MADLTVAEIMRTDVAVVSPTDSIAVVARVMTDAALPGLPVVQGDELVGIVTEDDLVAREADVTVPSVVPFLDALFVADGGREFDDELRHVLALTAGDLMTPTVYNIRSDATLEQVATLMLDEGVNPVPVVDGANRLVGIVSKADLVRIIARLEDASIDVSDAPAR